MVSVFKAYPSAQVLLHSFQSRTLDFTADTLFPGNLPHISLFSNSGQPRLCSPHCISQLEEEGPTDPHSEAQLPHGHPTRLGWPSHLFWHQLAIPYCWFSNLPGVLGPCPPFCFFSATYLSFCHQDSRQIEVRRSSTVSNLLSPQKTSPELLLLFCTSEGKVLFCTFPDSKQSPVLLFCFLATLAPQFPPLRMSFPMSSLHSRNILKVLLAWRQTLLSFEIQLLQSAHCFPQLGFLNVASALWFQTKL